MQSQSTENGSRLTKLALPRVIGNFTQEDERS